MTDLQTSLKTALPSRIDENLAASTDAVVPCFYAITGSHLYGTDTPSSDIDIKGFHCAPGEQYLAFDPPDPQQKFTTEVESEQCSIEVTSYELKKFGEMLYKSDFSLIELICGDTTVYSHDEEILTGIEERYAGSLPTELPQRYLGMADSIYDSDLVESSPTSEAALKPLVYALRGCLAAEFVQTHNAVEPRLLPLASAILDNEELEAIQQFVAVITKGESPDAATIATVSEVIEAKLDQLQARQFNEDDRAAYKSELTEWMLAVRTKTGTR